MDRAYLRLRADATRGVENRRDYEMEVRDIKEMPGVKAQRRAGSKI